MNNRRVEQYSTYIGIYDKPYKGAYTGVVNLPSEESKLYAISNSFGIVFPMYYRDTYMVGYSVYLASSKFNEWLIAKLYKGNNIWSNNYPNSIDDYNIFGLSISYPYYYFKENNNSVITFISYAIDLRITWYVILIYGDTSSKLSSYMSQRFYTSNAVGDQHKYFNNYSVKKYASVIKCIPSSRGYVYIYTIGNHGNSFFRIIRGETSNNGYPTEYQISYLDISGYPYKDEGRVEHMGWLVLRSDNEKVIILVKSQDRTYGDTHAKFYYGIWKASVGQYGESLLSSSNYRCYYNIPSAITSVIGGDYWVSPDLKWLFYISLSGANYQGFSKGLHTIKGSSALFGDNGWTGVSYEMEGGGTDILNACQNYYILDVQFNSKSDKIMVLGNSSKGAFTDVEPRYSYAEGIQPDIILYFIWVENKKKFIKLNSSFIGGDALWNDYNNSISGGKGNAYKPLINFVNGEINFMYPGGNEPFNAYRYNLSFGD